MVIYVKIRHIVFTLIFALIIALLFITYSRERPSTAVLHTPEPTVITTPQATVDPILREEEEYYYFWSNPLIDYTSTE